MGFQGFSASGLEFLSELGKRDKAWFDGRRKLYQSEIVAPTQAFVSALGEALAERVSDSIVAQPRTNGSIAPINNDVRFAKDKPPYKDHLHLKFWDGKNKKLAPALHVRITEESVGFATGKIFESVDRWRELVAEDASGAQLAEALVELGRGRELDVVGQELKRVPKPYEPDHPRADLLRHKWLEARWPEPAPASIHDSAFVDWCAARLAACAPVHRWLLYHNP